MQESRTLYSAPHAPSSDNPSNLSKTNLFLRYLPLDEKHPQSPESPYGETKLAIEKMLINFSQIPTQKLGIEQQFRAVALRYFNVCGVHPTGVIGDAKVHNLIPIVFNRVKQGKAVTIFGTDYDTRDGTCIRDYIDVNDLIEGHIRAMEKISALESSEKNTSFFKAYNLGTGLGTSVKEIIDACKEVIGDDFEVIEGERRLGDPAKLYAGNKYVTEDLGWKFQKSLTESIQSAWTFVNEGFPKYDGFKGTDSGEWIVDLAQQ